MGTAARRAGSAVRTTIRLIALFMITAWEGEEPEHPDQQRQPELGAAEADEPAENADTGAGGECGR
jgi:hypothetical protein